MRATDVVERRLREVAERREPLAPRPTFQALSLVERRCACSRDHYVMAGHHHRDRRMTAGSIDFLEASLTYQPSRPAFSSLPDCVESTTACRRKTAHRNDAALIRHLDGSALVNHVEISMTSLGNVVITRLAGLAPKTSPIQERNDRSG